MLTNAFRAIVRNPFKESFYGKNKKKKTINVLTAFFISIKNGIKSFLKWIFNRYPKGIHWHDPINN